MPHISAPRDKVGTKPVGVEIIAFAPTEFFHCTHCEVVWQNVGLGPRVHMEQRSASLPDDLAQDYKALAHWVKGLFEQYGDRVTVKVVDAVSPEGFFKSLLYRAFRYPAVIVDGRKQSTESNYRQAENFIAERAEALFRVT